jgi:hypothetical protein
MSSLSTLYFLNNSSETRWFTTPITYSFFSWLSRYFAGFSSCRNLIWWLKILCSWSCDKFFWRMGRAWFISCSRSVSNPAHSSSRSGVSQVITSRFQTSSGMSSLARIQLRLLSFNSFTFASYSTIEATCARGSVNCLRSTSTVNYGCDSAL